MKRNRKRYTILQKGSAIFIILALRWLTVSAPFVFASQQEIAKQNKTANAQSPLADNEEETANPFGNTTEAKDPSGYATVSKE